MPESLPPLRPKSGLVDLWGGFALPLRALGLMLTTPRLLALTGVCAFVTGLVLLGLLIGLWPVASHLVGPADGASGWRSMLGAAEKVGLYLVLLVTLGLTLPSLVLSPLTDPLSEATERRLGGLAAVPSQGFFRGVWLSARHSLARLVLMVLGMGLLLPLNLIPAVGSAAYAVLSVAWSAWCVCAEYLSGPASRNGQPVRAAFRAMRARPFACLGLGFALYLLLWVPVLNVFLVPAAVVSGTLLYRQLVAAGALAPRTAT